MKKKLFNVVLEKEGRRLIVRDGKAKYFNDEMKNFPLEELSGQVASWVQIERNLIVEIKMADGKTYPEKRQITSTTFQSKEKSFELSSSFSGEPARAPYNFVPLNERIVPGQKGVDFDQYAEGRLSGVISLSIHTLTPFFIRGNKENFLNPKGQLILQGSSIRGMVRSLVEICSHGKFKADHQYEDRRMYFRAMADMANRLRDEYNNEIANDVEAGYLQYNSINRSYSIQPAQGFDRVMSKGRFQYFNSPEGYEVHSGGMKGKNQNWIIFPPNDEHPLPIDHSLIKAYEGDDNRANQVWDILKIARKGKWKNIDFLHGVPVFFKRTEGKVTSFGHTKNYRLPYPRSISDHVPGILKEVSHLDMAESIFGISGDNTLKIKAGRVYFEDSSPRKLSDVKTQITPLRILANPKPTTFQHYLEQQPLGMKTPSNKLKHWGDENADIRGYKQYWHKADTSKLNPNLWVEDSLVFKKDDIEKWNKKEISLPPYLKESLFNLKVDKDSNGKTKVIVEGDINTLPEKLRDLLVDFYNLDGSTYKKLNISKPQNSIVNLVLEKETFHAKVRFENLTEQELGALLFALDLPKGCAHKLGMGKPLGLGSVKITPTLTLIDRKKRYSSLFKEEGGEWESGESKEENIKTYKDAFAKYIGEQLGKTDIFDANSYWAHDERMKELKHMLTLEHDMRGSAVNWNSRTRYMEIEHPQNNNEYKGRPVLPKPSEVVNPSTFKKD